MTYLIVGGLVVAWAAFVLLVAGFAGVSERKSDSTHGKIK